MKCCVFTAAAFSFVLFVMLQDQPEQLIGLLLLHVAQQGGLAAAHDLVMLGDLLASLLAADVYRHQGDGGTSSSSSSRSWMQAGGVTASDQAAFLTPQAALKQLQGLSAVQQRVLLFVLQCLQLLPVPVALTVAGEVLLRPLGHVLGWETEVVQWGLLVAAVAAEGVHTLPAGPRAGTAAAATAALLCTCSSCSCLYRPQAAVQAPHNTAAAGEPHQQQCSCRWGPF